MNIVIMAELQCATRRSDEDESASSSLTWFLNILIYAHEPALWLSWILVLDLFDWIAGHNWLWLYGYLGHNIISYRCLKFYGRYLKLGGKNIKIKQQPENPQWHFDIFHLKSPKSNSLPVNKYFIIWLLPMAIFSDNTFRTQFNRQWPTVEVSKRIIYNYILCVTNNAKQNAPTSCPSFW